MTEDEKQLLNELSAERQGAIGEGVVVLCALASLIRTHPDPSAFAAEFRRFWHQLGSPNQAQPDAEPAAARIAQALSVVEQACPVPLGVRPPGVAEAPGS